MVQDDNTDHKMTCYDCGTVYKPLSKEVAIQLATEHCERFEHTRAHAEPAPGAELVLKQGMLPDSI